MADPPTARKCPFCSSSNVAKNGRQKATLRQKLTCRECGRHYQIVYTHAAYKLGIARRIDALADAGHSVRAIAHATGTAPGTVQTTRKRLTALYRAKLAEPYPIPPDVLHVVSFSGGKDSTALLIWALDRLPRDRLRVIFCDTGWENPLTYRFLEDINHRLLDGKLITLRSDRYRDLPDLAQKRGRFPSTKARFCTEELKIVPLLRWILTQTESLAIYQGIRAGESFARSKMQPTADYFASYLDYADQPYRYEAGEKKRKRTPLFYRQVMEWLDHHEASVERPLFHWKEADVLAFCRRHNALNPLYELGFRRVGCFPCIMENKQGLRALTEHFPARIEEIAAIEGAIGSSFFPYSKIPPSISQTPTIRDVIAWAHDGHRAQDGEEWACMSHFGKCE